MLLLWLGYKNYDLHLAGPLPLLQFLSLALLLTCYDKGAAML